MDEFYMHQHLGPPLLGARQEDIGVEVTDWGDTVGGVYAAGEWGSQLGSWWCRNGALTGGGERIEADGAASRLAWRR
jgi:hypothetical protein